MRAGRTSFVDDDTQTLRFHEFNGRGGDVRGRLTACVNLLWCVKSEKKIRLQSWQKNSWAKLKIC